MIGRGEQRRIGIVGDAHGKRAAPAGFAQAGQGKRCRTARRNADQHVVIADVVLGDQLFGGGDIVFRPLDRLRHGRIAARQQQQQTLRRPTERRHQLGAILNGKPPRRTCSHVDEPALLAQPGLDAVRRLLDRRSCASYRSNR